MELTALQIVDTAVKIGLGALISGLATYFVVKAGHKEELRRERLKRKSELIERVASQVEEVTHVALKYWATVTTLATRPNYSRREKAEALLPELQDELFAAFKEMSSAEGLLLLIGESRSQALLRSYGEFIDTDIASLIDKRHDSPKEVFTAARKQLLERRRSFFDELSNAYIRQGI